MPNTNLASALDQSHQAMHEAFPEVDHGRVPLLNNYIVQVKRAITISAGGLVIPDEVRKSEAANCTIGKVVAISRTCFHYPNGKPWEEGPSFVIGEFLQIPRFGGFRFSVKWRDEEIDFVVWDHLQQIAKISGDPRLIRTYL